MFYREQYKKKAHGEADHIFRNLLPQAGLHVREAQIRLCHQMLEALLSKEIALCDAGVGIGKTYAYLVACILMRKYASMLGSTAVCTSHTVVVSTASIALQKAILTEYIPFLSKILWRHKVIASPLQAVVRKGKEHFVCDYRLEERMDAIREKPKNPVQRKALLSLKDHRDMDEVQGLSGFDRRLVCVPKFCPRECPGRKECRYQKYLEQAKKPEVFIQICNHNYLLADAMHRCKGYRPLLPDYRALIVDEAHKLQEAAMQMYGKSFGQDTILELTSFLVKEHQGQAARQLRAESEQLLLSLKERYLDVPSGRIRFEADAESAKLFAPVLVRLRQIRERLKEHFQMGTKQAGRNRRNPSHLSGIEPAPYLLSATRERNAAYFMYSQPGYSASITVYAVAEKSPGNPDQRHPKSRGRICKDQTGHRTGEKREGQRVCGRLALSLPEELSALSAKDYPKGKKGK